MNIINMAEELFVRAPEEMTLIASDIAERMKKDILAAEDIGNVMFMLNEHVVPKFKGAGRFTELLDILKELHGQLYRGRGFVSYLVY